MEHLNLSYYIDMIPSSFSVIIYGAIVFSLLCVGVILLTSFFAQKENGVLAEQLAETKRDLEVNKIKLARLQKNHAKKKEFQSNLRMAELTTTMQKPRLEAQNRVRITGDNSPPEKYRYLQSLAQKGMPADEIASVLAISPHEARQLVTLSKIASTTGGNSAHVAG